MGQTLSRTDAIQFIKAQPPIVFLEPDRQNNGFVCPSCGNGSGANGDGMRRIPNSAQWKCFKCGLHGDVIDLIGVKFGLSDFNEKLRKAEDLYGVEEQNGNSPVPSKPSKEAPRLMSNIEKIVKGALHHEDLSEYLEKCHCSVSETDFFAKRGISQDSIAKFNLGFDSDFHEGTGSNSWKAAIIPTSNETFEARNTDVEPNSKKDSGNKYRKHGPTRIFNRSAISNEKEQPIFVVEGAIDAISIIQCGGQAIGLGSANNYTSLIKELDSVAPAHPFILALDNDDAGQKASLSLESELNQRNVPYLAWTTELIGDFHDPNDRLLHDEAGLKAAINNAVENARALKSPFELEREAYLNSCVSEKIDVLSLMISQAYERQMLSTGFKSLDQALNGGIFSQFYILGAESSLGKTTLMLQIADRIVQQGEDVLFFSLEQSVFELMSKSISRETYLYCKRNGLDLKSAKSNLEILDGRHWHEFDEEDYHVISESMEAYEKFTRHHMFVHESVGKITVQEIREIVKKHIAFTGNKRPIVFVDYLQTLKEAKGDERATEKQATDHKITELKQLSRDFDIPVLVISSLNRTSYNGTVGMSAFKESGSIEYGADVLIGLQFKCAGETGFKINEAKKKEPRDVELVILKNRNSPLADGISLKYFAKFNCFEEA